MVTYLCVLTLKGRLHYHEHFYGALPFLQYNGWVWYCQLIFSSILGLFCYLESVASPFISFGRLLVASRTPWSRLYVSLHTAPNWSSHSTTSTLPVTWRLHFLHFEHSLVLLIVAKVPVLSHVLKNMGIWLAMAVANCSVEFTVCHGLFSIWLPDSFLVVICFVLRILWGSWALASQLATALPRSVLPEPSMAYGLLPFSFCLFLWNPPRYNVYFHIFRDYGVIFCASNSSIWSWSGCRAILFSIFVTFFNNQVPVFHCM